MEHSPVRSLEDGRDFKLHPVARLTRAITALVENGDLVGRGRASRARVVDTGNSDALADGSRQDLRS